MDFKPNLEYFIKTKGPDWPIWESATEDRYDCLAAESQMSSFAFQRWWDAFTDKIGYQNQEIRTIQQALDFLNKEN